MSWLARLRRGRPGPSTGRPRVLVVMLDPSVRDLLVDEPPLLDLPWFSSSAWPVRPSSTARLNLVNVQALRRLAPDTDVTIVETDRVTPRVAEALHTHDVVAFLLVSSPRSRRLVPPLLEHLRTETPSARVVFGTELTWRSEIAKGTLTNDDFAWILAHATVLRHTAKTEIGLYASAACTRSDLVEFPLGVDTDVVTGDVVGVDRPCITFVLAPDGRPMKQNDEALRLAELVRGHPSLAGAEVRVLEPPYSTVELWELARRSTAVVMTSLTETFSYVLHDAAACGAVVLHPGWMFANTVRTAESGGRPGRTFVADSFPRTGLRYYADDDLLNALVSCWTDDDARRRESARTRLLLEEEHSVEAVARRWHNLLHDEELAPARLLVVDGPRTSPDDARALAAEVGASVVLPLHDPGRHVPEPRLSVLDEAHDVVTCSDYLTLHDSTLRRAHGVVPRGAGRVGERSLGEVVDADDVEERTRFLQLLVRLHRVGTVVLAPGLDPMVRAALERVTVRHRLHGERVPVSVEPVSGDDLP